ncbi:hypothetical protein AURDEDRAFT_159932 [Auricularia subglabra TFB-10046 SS5]|nr:hypothetical protein AURDEDRAFT_159932 [Auricularia subglabra TFB-10046 SS5]
MSSITRTLRHLSHTPLVPPNPALAPVEVPMVTFRDHSVPIASLHSRTSSIDSAIMVEESEPGVRVLLEVTTPWTRL